MKSSNLFIGGIIFILIVIFFLAGCTKASCPTYSDNTEYPDPMVIQQDTVISVSGDTTYIRQPYQLSRFEKIGFVITAGVVFWVIDYHRDHNKDP
jgi:hypothetical protein